jgi:hypothetical protein
MKSSYLLCFTIGEATVHHCGCTMPLRFVGSAIRTADVSDQWERYACLRCETTYDYDHTARLAPAPASRIGAQKKVSRDG